MKLFTAKEAIKKGFTLIELLVVIAVLAILAVGLIAVIDPADKVNSTNDAAVISSIAQFGRANDSYAVSHNNIYVGTSGSTGSIRVNAALADLQASGEIKSTSYTAPTNYTVDYATTPSCTTAGANCVNYAFWGNLKSKKYTTGIPPVSGPIYVWANGKGCFVSTTPTATTVCP